MTPAPPIGPPSAGTPASADDPEAYVSEDRRWALAGGVPVDGRRQGTTLFADVSGFTALTETLADELGPQRGAEELTGVLERVFGALIGALHERGGAVVYFSGDAITCWFDGDTGPRAVTSAFAIQDTMGRVGTVVSPGGRTVVLGVKVAVAGGRARRFVVGDPAVQLIDVLAGSLMDEVAAAEGTASPGEVVVTLPVLEAVGSAVTVVEHRVGDLGPVAAVTDLTVREPAWRDFAGSPALPPEEVRQWLLPAIYERMRTGRGEFLAELRPAVPVFFAFHGIDFDDDDESPRLLDEFIVAAQRVIDGYGGSLLQLTVGDKGAYLYAVFGSPEAHEDDATRACAAALDLLDLQDDVVTDIRVGIASGRLRSGTYGHPRRRTFCCLGDAVNLAARLMGKAGAGGVMVSDAVRRAAGPDFRFGDVELLTLKGKARATAAARLLAVETSAASGRETALVGRVEELARVRAAVADAVAGRARVLGVRGEPGIGKTRLLTEVLTLADTEGVETVMGSARAYGTVTAYSAWWGIWRHLLGVTDDLGADELAALLDEVLPADLRPRAPLVGALVGMPLPDNELTASFDAKLRKTSLEQLAGRLLLTRAEAPLVVVLDDAHLLEPLGRDLLSSLARAAAGLPVALLMAYRDDVDLLPGLDLGADVAAEEVRLGPLDDAESTRLVETRLAALFGTTPVPEGLTALVVQRSDGNPLWSRELCRYLHERAQSGDAGTGDGTGEVLDIPGTLHGLVLNRLDQLPENPRRTAKVAGVIGQTFVGELVLRGYPELGAPGDLRRSLQELAERDVARAEDHGDDRWAFTHALLRDVAYDSLPFAMRALLHQRVADAIADGALGDPDRRLDDLAHHYWHTDDDVRKVHYLRRAGEAAQAAYANDAALEHYRRLLTLLPEPEQVDVWLRVGRILELQTEWTAAEEAFGESLRLAVGAEDRSGEGWARTWGADLARKQGRFAEARTGLDGAAALFAAAGDDPGAGQVLHLQGTLAAQQGDLARAREHYEQSLAVRERLDDRHGMGALYSNLAIVAEYSGDYARAQQLAERGLEIRRGIGDRWGIGISENNLGMLATLQGDPRGAKQRFTESMRLHTEVGDPWMVALGHHNLGNAARDLGEVEEARSGYATALTAFRRYDDAWALALLLEDVALLDAALDRIAEAWWLVGASDRLHDGVGAPRTPDVATRLDEALAEVTAAAGLDPAALRAQGAALGWPDVEALVLPDGHGGPGSGYRG